MRKAIILCSGGLDSVTTANYVKKRLNYDSIIVLFFNYGQRNLEGEEIRAKQCATDLNANFIKVDLDWLGEISTSSLNSDGGVRSLTNQDLKDTKEEGEKWYVPCRNSVFLVNALALAESLFIKNKEKNDIFIGFKCEGEESYPDTTKEFVEVMNKLGSVGCSGKFKIIAPLIEKDKEDIVTLARELDLDFKKTFSCYVGPVEHCGSCLACKLRQQGFKWANVEDPTVYL